VYVNNKLVKAYQGPTLLKDFNGYMKIGMYNGLQKYLKTVYYDDVKILKKVVH